jgi:hypothetical protein
LAITHSFRPLLSYPAAKKDEVEFECKTKTGGNKDEEANEADKTEGNVETRGISIIPNVEIKDKIKYKVQPTNEGIRVKLEYKTEIEADDTETETKTKFDLLFFSLVEYVKGSNDTNSEAYDWDMDEIVQTIPLTEWEDISAVMDSAEGGVSYFSATTMAMSDIGGTASFNFTVARADQGEHITANSMKIDVHILDFPWTRTDSYIALMSTLESKLKMDVEYDSESTIPVDGSATSVSKSGKDAKAKRARDVTISFGSEMAETLGWTTFGEYKWEKDAKVAAVVPGNETSMTTVEEMTIEVLATSPISEGNETLQSIAYSFVGSAAQGAPDIYWDPSAGVGYETESSSAGSVLQFGFRLAGVIVGALMLVAW